MVISPLTLQVASVVGVIFILGVYLTVFSYWLNIPDWVGPVIMLGLIPGFILIPLPILYWKSRLWLLKKMVRISVFLECLCGTWRIL